MPPAMPEDAVGETTPEPALLEEILEQIFLRLQPHEPACLVRASLASKLWLALLTGPRFRALYRDHHGAPPMLGFLTSTPWDSAEPEKGEPFVSTTGFRARVPEEGWGQRDYTAWDCRHGRVLLGENNALLHDVRRLAVWDPITGRRRELVEPVLVYGYGLYAAAVLCAASGCDHFACHQGPFRVVHLSLHKDAGDDFVVQARVSSPETYDCGGSKPRSDFHRAEWNDDPCPADFLRVEWSDPCPGVNVGSGGYIEPRPPVLIKDALHFMLAHDGDDDHVHRAEILKYDLSSNRLSVLDAPMGGANMVSGSILMAMEDGSLGFAHLKELKTIFIWSRQMGSDGAAAWTQRRVIGLNSILPTQNPVEDIRLLGSMEGSDIIFVTTDLGIYKIDLKSLQHKKISNAESMVSLIPYMGFYNP